MRNYIIKIIAFISVLLALGTACKGRENPLDKIYPRTGSVKNASTYIEPPPKTGSSRSGVLGMPQPPRTGSASDILDDDGDIVGVVPTQGQAFTPINGQPPKGPRLAPPVVVPVPVIPPLPPIDDFANIIPFNWGFAQCGNNIVSQEVLEDGTIVGEQCEDGNAQNGDGCSSTCLKEFCGNGLVEYGEECDPGQSPTSPPTVPPLWNHAIPTEWCDEFCERIICGDGKVNGHEECDDCNQTDCDGCSSKCKVENLREAPCNYTCTPPEPFSCPFFVLPASSCVDSVTCPYEDCGTDSDDQLICCGFNEVCSTDAIPVCKCPNTVCNGNCCGPTEICGLNGFCTCPNAVCNGICCAANQACVGLGCGTCDNIICNDICCDAREVCAGGQCRCPNVVCNGICCDSRQICMNSVCTDPAM